MPLSFDSVSHGTIAFGFFNIESDMLLCDRYFLFAMDFCNYMENLAEYADAGAYQMMWQVYFIESSQEIGDLMGAIHGIRFTGFIGELYLRFPFPGQSSDFKQNPEGKQNQALIIEMIEKYAQRREITVTISPAGKDIEIGDYRFNRVQFQALIKYVWRGGYPRWKGEIRPDYVIKMKDKIHQNRKGLFKDIVFED